MAGCGAINWSVRWTRLCWLALLLAASACGDDAGGDDDDDAPSGGSSGTPCVSGVSYSCVGPGGCQGVQLCGSNGFLASCRCTPGTPPEPTRDASASEDAAAPASDSGSEPERDAAEPPEDAAEPPGSEEDCSNDSDDDGDGDDDCADDDCNARTCVEVAPFGWAGPVLLYEGANAPPDCAGEYPDEAAQGGTDVSADPAECSACTCTPEDPGCAAFLNFETSTNSTCGDDPAPCSTSINSSCAVLTSPCLSGATAYVESHLPGTPPTCTASDQNATVPAADWDEYVRACAPARALQRAGCDRGEVCAPEPAFDGDLCIVDDGDVPCPAGPYSDRRVYYTHIADSRGCSACACAHDCQYTWRVFEAADTTCTTPLTLTEENQCASVNPVSGSIRVNVTIAGSGECAPSGGAATGSAQAEDPITACCLP